MKRTDSIQSRRKVSSLSDRSDTSDQGGEESPGILSDDQPPESPSDSNDTDETGKTMPWMKSILELMNSFNYYCSHQNYCHPYCYRRHMRAASRLLRAVRKVNKLAQVVFDQSDDVMLSREREHRERERASERISGSIWG